MSITIREGNVYYQLDFSYDVTPNGLAIPAPTMFLDFKFYLNSHLLTVADDDQLVRSIASKFEPFWNKCQYDTSINISDASPYTFSLVCKDSVFAPNILYEISTIEIRLSVLSLVEIDLSDLMIAFNYLMISWFMNEEQNYPAIFSSVGRQFIKLNLIWYKKMYYEVLETQLVNSEKVITDYIYVVKRQYTTLKLMCIAEIMFDRTRRNKGRNCIVKSYPLHLIDLNSPDIN
ncbi:hypothetical protein CORT_0F02690 [Candida orthopsilosis Co 90-125]|uniref:Uncharacterized protein n=1 Tax=Candida orthopsilosis (strain 90-125) TaxID=1136231 RepID=H8X8L8_CANO9|nr:hypothetical protein CORT_0F02690 [Candida orthopsilosis Co 90-125]CCG24493.1 hypothetical protein CORT_0F02690 [Candida orthopsilosis Co 90-125]